MIRPVCRPGTQKLFVDHFKKMQDALTTLVPAKGSAGNGIPVSLSITWRSEFMIQYAFALEDAGRQPEGIKLVDEVAAMLKAEADNDTVTLFCLHTPQTIFCV